MIDFAIFDIAGTTVTDKNYVAHGFQKAFLKHNILIEHSEVSPLMGYAKPTAIEMVLEKEGINIDEELVNRIHADFVSEMIDFYRYSPYVKPIDDAEDLFFYLKEHNIKIALNTGFSKDIAEVIIERFQWLERGLIDDFIASDEVEQGRPFPYMIEKLKQRNQINKDNQVMKVGDTVVDILEGKNANCKYVIAVTTGAAIRAELEFYEPTHIVSSLSEIPAILSESKNYA